MTNRLLKFNFSISYYAPELRSDCLEYIEAQYSLCKSSVAAQGSKSVDITALFTYDLTADSITGEWSIGEKE